MAKVDRLGWTAGISLVSYGVRVGVRVNDPGVLERIVPLLPPGWKPLASPEVQRLYSLRVGGEGPRPGLRNYHLLYAKQLRVARTLDLEEALRQLESDLHLYVAEKARRRLFVHAGVVGWRDRAIVVPGRSFSGKSTLVAALVRAGATYYSDEFAVLDDRGMVHPYPRPLSLRRGDGGLPDRVLPEALGGRTGAGPLPVGMVVIGEYREGVRWRPRRLTPGKAILELMANTVRARHRSGAAIRTLRRLACEAAVIKGARSEADDVAREVLRRSDRDARVVS